MSTDPPALGKGVFGYRKSAVNQIIADRDTMLRQAEGRVRAAESKVNNLETELNGMRERNQRMEEQLERLRMQLNALAASGQLPSFDQPILPTPAPPTELDEVEPSVPESTRPAEAVPAARAPQAESTPYFVEPSVEETATAEPWLESTPVAMEQARASAEPAYPQAAAEGAHAETGDEPAEASDSPQPLETYRIPAPSGSEEAAGSEVSSEGAEGADEPADFQSGFDADAFGQHFIDYGDQEASYGYRYDWSEPGETPQAAPAEATADQPAAVEPDVSYDTFGLGPVSELALEQSASAPEAPAQHDPAAPQLPVQAPTSSDVASKLVSDELAGILAAAEESAARIIDRARAATEHQLARSDRVWQQVQTEVSKFVTWRQGVEPVISAVQSKVEGVRELIERVPERIREALAPMAESISLIDADLTELATVSTPPLLLTPSAFESEGDEGEWSTTRADPSDPSPAQNADPEDSTRNEDDLGGPAYGYRTG